MFQLLDAYVVTEPLANFNSEVLVLTCMDLTRKILAQRRQNLIRVG